MTVGMTTFALLALTLGAPQVALAQDAFSSYEIDLRDRSDDTFKVRVTFSELSAVDSIFQFATTAPGTYQVMDIGRFVSDFSATDAQGRSITVEKVDLNRWRLSDASRVRSVRYTISETWDTPVAEHPVYRMAGTSLEDDHALVNPHAVFGFPATRQEEPVRVRFATPRAWRIGSALVPDVEGWYPAESYDHLVDSPFLMGRVSSASIDVMGVPVEVWVYSKTDKVTAEQLLATMETMLLSAGEFLGELPVDRYAFLWHLEDLDQGAWEHSYSSEYVMQEPPVWSEQYGQGLTDIAAHEFFHIVTPLNIHSEIIEYFDFSEPTPSEHLWLYEGVTEWASDIMQMRSRLIVPDELLGRVAQEIQIDERFFDPDYSLSRLALTSYSDEGQTQYGNIYNRGAVVAGLLDIRLLELSGGRVGLRELLMELAEEYGKDRPFDEKGLFDLIEEKSFGEIGDFFDDYVKAAEPLPIAEYYLKLGIRYFPGRRPRFEIMDDATPEQLRLRSAWMRLRPIA
jgi:predicted metalloprotease with PDZ domain